jgi:hypothetical protein
MFCSEEEILKSQKSGGCEKMRKNKFSKNDAFVLGINCSMREEAPRQLLASIYQVRCVGKRILIFSTFEHFS